MNASLPWKVLFATLGALALLAGCNPPPPPPACQSNTQCDDGNACTADACDQGQCKHDPVNADDGDACTVDACDPVAGVTHCAVTCDAPTACHQAGVCNPSNGQCEYANATDGTACNDGNACTQADACLAGACRGSNPVTCAAPGACQQGGTCNPGNGQCEYANAPDGTACSDGSACTQTDSCQAGACRGANPVTCAPADECHRPGTCRPADGTCDAPAVADGTPCSVGACEAGICTPASLRIEVYSLQGAPVPGASVTLGTTTYTTGVSGTVTISTAPVGPAVAQVVADGYAPASAVADVQAGVENGAVVHLMPYPQQMALDADQGGEVARENVKVTFPPGALVDSFGLPVGGTVGVSVIQVDPATTDAVAMPGPLIGRDSAGREEPLASVLMAEVGMWQGNQPLELAPGAQASLELTLPDALQRTYSAGDQIPSWSFDVATGVWREEGVGTIQVSSTDPTKKVWVTQVTHFTWYNVDQRFSATASPNCALVTVDNANVSGAHLSGVTVRAAGQTGLFTGPTAVSIGTYGGSSPVCLNVPYTAVSEVTVSKPGWFPAGGFTLTPRPNYSQVGPNLLSANNPSTAGCSSISTCASLLFQMTQPSAVRGQVTIGAAPAVGAQVYIQYDVGTGPVTATAVTSATGAYCINVPAGLTNLPVRVTLPTSGGRYQTGQTTIPTITPTGACGGATFNTAPVVAINPASCSGPLCAADWNVLGGDASSQAPAGIAADQVGNVYVTGTFSGTLSLGGGCAPKTTAGGLDVFLAKLDITGRCVWLKSFGGMGTERASAIAVDSGNNVIVVGNYNAGGLDFGGGALQVPSFINGYMAKFDGNGTHLWSFAIWGNGGHYPQALAVDTSPNNLDSIAVAGYYNGDITGHTPVSQGDDGFVMIISPTGAIVGPAFRQFYAFGGPGTEHANGVAFTYALTGPGDIVLTGEFDSAFSFDTGLPVVAPDGLVDGFVARFKNINQGSVNPSWFYKFGGGPGDINDQRGVAVAVDTMNEIVVAGTFDGTVAAYRPAPLTPLPPAASLGGNDALLFKMDPAGSRMEWLKSFGDINMQQASGVAVATNGDIFLTGSFVGRMTFNDTPATWFDNVSFEDMFMARIRSADGITVWARRDGNAGGFVFGPRVATAGAVGQPCVAATTGGPTTTGLDLGLGVLPWAGNQDVLVARFLP